MVNFYFLFLIPLMIASGGTDVEVIIDFRGEDVSLHCDGSLGRMDREDCYRGTWMKFLNNNREAILDQCDKWTPGEDMSLKFSKLKESDEGLYSCEIWNGWERVYIRIISLKTEGPLSECNVEVVVKVSSGSSIELKCPVTDLLGAPNQISWFMFNAGTPGAASPGAVPSERAKEEGLSLDSDRGWYSCKYNIRGTQRCFSFNQPKAIAATEPTMTVQPSIQVEKEEGNTSVVFLLVKVTAAVALLIGILAVWRYVDKRFAAQPESQRPDAVVSRSPDEYENVDFQPIENE